MDLFQLVVFHEITYNSSDWRKAVLLREKILRAPLGSRFSEEELREEANHIQIAGFLDDDLVATAVLVPENDQLKMQRVVVAEDLTNQGIGSQMMIFCEKVALERGFRILYCHARDTAVNFYLRNHYQTEGDYSLEDGIPHIKMKKEF